MTITMHKQTYTIPIFSGAGTGVKRGKMRGAATVELALLLIPLLLLVLGVAEYGRALYQYNTLVKSVRDSARFLSQYNPADASYPLADARCLALYGNICSGGTTPLAPGLTSSMVKIIPVPPATNPVTTPLGTTMQMVEVRIENYQFTFALNPSSLLGGGAATMTFPTISATMRQS